MVKSVKSELEQAIGKMVLKAVNIYGNGWTAISKDPEEKLMLPSTLGPKTIQSRFTTLKNADMKHLKTFGKNDTIPPHYVLTAKDLQLLTEMKEKERMEEKEEKEQGKKEEGVFSAEQKEIVVKTEKAEEEKKKLEGPGVTAVVKKDSSKLVFKIGKNNPKKTISVENKNLQIVGRKNNIEKKKKEKKPAETYVISDDEEEVVVNKNLQIGRKSNIEKKKKEKKPAETYVISDDEVNQNNSDDEEEVVTLKTVNQKLDHLHGRVTYYGDLIEKMYYGIK